MKLKTFKIRSSATSQIMGNLTNITDKQLIQLNELQAKDKRTENQQITLNELILKRDTPSDLSQGAKTYCDKWIKEQLYNRKKSFASKYTDKGLIMEDNSLDFIAEQLNFGMIIKNELFFCDEYKQGTPDAILNDMIIDVKNSWDEQTFPLFSRDIPNKDYYWQAQSYMSLVDRSDYKLIYVLSDTPEHLIRKEAYYFAKNNGYDDLTEDIYDMFVKKMTYSDVVDSLKMKVFDIKRNNNDIALISQQVMKCREYIKDEMNYLINQSLINRWKITQ